MKKFKRELIILIILLGYFIYFFSVFNGFVWDDEEQILNNQMIRSFNSIPYFFLKAPLIQGVLVV